jgi:hypothetical protein
MFQSVYRRNREILEARIGNDCTTQVSKLDTRCLRLACPKKVSRITLDDPPPKHFKKGDNKNNASKVV